MQNQIKRAIELSKKTGDRIIIVDKNSPDDAFVVMNLSEYEKLISEDKQNFTKVENLTENGLLDRINRDIAIWKNNQEIKDWDREDVENQENIDDFEDENLYYYDNEEEANLYEKYFSEKEDGEGFKEDKEINEKINKNNPWQIPKKIKESAEEVLGEDFY